MRGTSWWNHSSQQAFQSLEVREGEAVFHKSNEQVCSVFKVSVLKLEVTKDLTLLCSNISLSVLNFFRL